MSKVTGLAAKLINSVSRRAGLIRKILSTCMAALLFSSPLYAGYGYTVTNTAEIAWHDQQGTSFSIESNTVQTEVEGFVTWAVIDSFENDSNHDDETNAPDAQWWATDGVYNYSVTGEQSFNGDHSLRVEYNKNGHQYAYLAAGNLHTGSNNISDFSVSVSSSISVWVRPDEPVEILMKFEDADSQSTGDLGTLTADTTGAWQRLTWNWDEAKLGTVDLTKINHVLLFIAPGSADATGTVYLDDLKLDGVGQDVRNVLAEASQSDFEIDLYWPAASSEDGLMGQYHIYRAEAGFTSTEDSGVELVYSTTSLRWTDSGLSPGTEYFYSIIGEDTEKYNTPMTLNLSALTPAAIVENLLANASFEEGTGQGNTISTSTVITGWTHWGDGFWDNDVAYDGTWSIKRWNIDTGIYQDFNATAGNTYAVSLQAYDGSGDEALSAGARLKLNVEWFADGNIKIGETETVATLSGGGPTDTWVELSGSDKAPANTGYGRFIIVTEEDGGAWGGSVFYDLATVTLADKFYVNEEFTIEDAEQNIVVTIPAGLFGNTPVRGIVQPAESALMNIADSKLPAGARHVAVPRDFSIVDSDGNPVTDFGSGGITIRFGYPNSLTLSDRNMLRVVKLDENAKEWRIQEDYTINAAAGWIEARLSSLSVYGLIVYPNSSVGDVYVYPNPFKPGDRDFDAADGGGIVIANLPESADIRIFSIAGELVDSFTHIGGTSINWKKAERVASGVYILIVNSGGEVKTQKFAVVK